MIPNAVVSNPPSRFGQAVWLLAALPILGPALLLYGSAVGCARFVEAARSWFVPPIPSAVRRPGLT